MFGFLFFLVLDNLPVLLAVALVALVVKRLVRWLADNPAETSTSLLD